MAKNRKEAEAFILKYIAKLDKSGFNTKLYTDRFKTMTNSQFEDMMANIRDGKYVPPLYVANGTMKINSSDVVKVARELKHEFFERLRLTDNATGETYLTPIKYMIVKLPLRRQAQLLAKKMSIPSTSRNIDVLSGQATGDYKGASLSFPELQVLAASNMHDSIKEMVKIRGGDANAYTNFRNSVINTGSGSITVSSETEGRVKSTETLSALLKGMHLDNNL